MRTTTMTNDSKRRASDALIAALEEGVSLTQILELAMDDNGADETTINQLSDYHDQIVEVTR